MIVVGAGVCVEIWNPARLADPSRAAHARVSAALRQAVELATIQASMPGSQGSAFIIPARVTRSGNASRQGTGQSWHGCQRRSCCRAWRFSCRCDTLRCIDRLRARRELLSRQRTLSPLERASSTSAQLRYTRCVAPPRDRCRSTAAPMKPAKSGCGGGRLRFELRMELHRHEPGMVGQLDDFDQRAVGARAGDEQARGPRTAGDRRC